MAASPVGKMLSVSEAEGFEPRLKVYKDTSKSEKTANKQKNYQSSVIFLRKCLLLFKGGKGWLHYFIFVYVSATLSTVKTGL